MNLSFNKSLPTIMHIDINSCFATIEQQANPMLRGRPIAVAAYDSPKGVILAPSIEAKVFGVKTGTRVSDGKALCPNLIILSADPDKYRHVHVKLHKLLAQYTNNLHPKSIDEFVLNFAGLPALKQKSPSQIAKEIKTKIKKEVGEWIWVSIGIGPNRFLAKTGAGYKKPDGLTLINHKNFLKIYKNLKLTDLTGINTRNEIRLKRVGINSVLDFYNSPLWRLKAAFHSIAGYYWYVRLRGHETCPYGSRVDTTDFARRSYGNSYSLPKPFIAIKDLSPILAKLVNKMSSRLRAAGYASQGVHLSVSYRDGSHWHKGKKTQSLIFDTRDIYEKAFSLLKQSPRKPVRNLAVSCFNLSNHGVFQLELFEDINKKQFLMGSVDKINKKWGKYVITTANMLGSESSVPDRIAFGGVKELEEIRSQH